MLLTSGTDQIEHTVVGLMFHADFVLHKHCLSAGDKYDVWVLILYIFDYKADDDGDDDDDENPWSCGRIGEV